MTDFVAGRVQPDLPIAGNLGTCLRRPIGSFAPILCRRVPNISKLYGIIKQCRFVFSRRNRWNIWNWSAARYRLRGMARGVDRGHWSCVRAVKTYGTNY